MSDLPKCPWCGQPFKHAAGIYLPPLSSRIFAMIHAAGPDGISPEALYERLYTGQKRPKRSSIKGLVSELRSKLAGTNWLIGTRDGAYVLGKDLTCK